MTTTGLPPADVTGFHIHLGTVGVNGLINVDFMPLGGLTPVGTGFTFTATGQVMPASNEAAFLGGGTYVNIHTAVFPGGAIRGQLFSGGNSSLATGTATGTTAAVTNIENVTGGAGNDSLVGSFAVNIINGGAGGDWIVAGPGADIVNGGAGGDTLVWSNGDGTDVVEGGTEVDTVQVNGSTTSGDFFTVAPNGTNWGFYQDAGMDALLEQARTTFDAAEQDKVLQKIHEKMVDDALFLFVTHDVNSRAVSPKVTGFVQAQNWFQDFSPITMK